MISKFRQRVYLRSLRSFVKNIVKNYYSFTPPLLEDLLSEGSAELINTIMSLKAGTHG